MEPLSHKIISFTRQKKVRSETSLPPVTEYSFVITDNKTMKHRCSQPWGGCTQIVTDPGQMHPVVHRPRVDAPRCLQTQDGCTQIFTSLRQMYQNVHGPHGDVPRCSRPQGECTQTLTAPGWIYSDVHGPRVVLLDQNRMEWVCEGYRIRKE